MSASKELLRNWSEQLGRQLEEARGELAQLQLRIQQDEEKLTLVERLLALEHGDTSSQAATHQSSTESAALLVACEAILDEASRPLHISDLHNLLLERRIPIPGKGTEANLIARIQRSNGRVIRVGRGLYGLPKFDIPEKRPLRRVKKP